MRLVNVSNVASVEDIQIQTSFEKLNFIITSATGSIGDPTAQIKLIGRDGTKTILDRLPLRRLLEMSTAGEGCFVYGNNTTANTGGAIKGSLIIGDGGAVNFTDMGYMSLSVYKDPAQPNFNVEVSTTDNDVATRNYIHYDPISILAGTTRREVSLLGVTALGIPFASIDALELQYPNKTVAYTASELGLENLNSNDIIHVDLQGKIFTPADATINHIYLDVDKVTSAVVQMPNGAPACTIYLLKSASL